mgnify:CR=1 FL=1|jgi:ribosomal protein S18 acetylase RimI-like enzyme
MNIREYEDADRDAVIKLWEACELTRPWNDPGQDIARCMAGKSSTIFVGLDDCDVVASVMVGDDGHRGWVYYVAVAPHLRCGGAGRVMMDHAERWLADNGAVKVILMIREGNDAVRSFYEQLGYQAEPRTVMSRWLTPS